MVSAAQSLDDKQFEQKDRQHKILTDKKSSDWKMWLSLVLTYAGFGILTVSNAYLLLRIARTSKFDNATNNLKLLMLDAVDSVHQLLFSIFFTIIFFCSLARIELLIDVLPDLVKNDGEFFRHKLVWSAIFVNTAVHCFIAVIALYINTRQNNSGDVNTVIVRVT
jgi:hypothetical protein